jgi:hypothetical protein
LPANAISGGGSAGLGKTEQVEIQNRNTRLQSILQKIEPGVNKVHDPELMQYLSDTMDRLGNAYDKNAYARAQQVGKARNYKYNPGANQALQDKIESYNPGNNQTQWQGLLGGQSQGGGQDPTILKYSQMHNIPYAQSAAILAKRGYKGGGQ